MKEIEDARSIVAVHTDVLIRTEKKKHSKIEQGITLVSLIITIILLIILTRSFYKLTSRK